MAEDQDTSQNDEQEEANGGNKKKLILFGGIGVVLIVTVVLVLWLFSGAPTDESAPAQRSMQTENDFSNAAAPETGSALYVGMPRPFVFIVPGDSRERTVQIKAQLMVRGEQNEELAKKHIPLIEGTLHEVFSSSTADRLKTAEGKGQLRELALTEVRRALQEIAGKPVVEQVLFTSLVMQ